MKNTIIIDADELLYKATISAEYELEIGDLHYVMSDFGPCRRIFLEATDKILDALASDYENATFALSSRQNFRKEVMPSYKSNRKDQRKPLAYRRLVEWLKETYETVEYDGLEADDVLGILSPEFDYMVSSDKDLLTVPGSLYSPMKDTVTHVIPATADWHWLMQTLTGDAVDGYKGCPKVGPVKAEKILSACVETPGEIRASEVEGAFQEVYAAYQQAGLSLEECLQNARVARILRPGEFQLGKPVLWSPA